MASKSHISLNRTCLCSPTEHPGSFRCSLHRSNVNNRQATISSSRPAKDVVKPNSIKEILLQTIKPSSSQDLQRRRKFQPKPSRFCSVSHSRNGVAVS
ncbi:hypothetical protein RchiOBHm_Chr2g0086941 [Rosa chinensis]|uniref:Uncharacterized protein n=1 Tax=Rosa chinensis TaxID=74649 RepID=A0A2P6RIJ7_ROSCH|nr:hypothetical protein RchiOBHm_Chr2g0086941 [Rosa chinensis]